jgi:biopolymer transport protein ExbD
VMLLIIFFTLTTHFAKTQLQPLDLPKEPGQIADAEQAAAITVDLRKDGSMSVLGGPLEMPGLLSMLQGEMQKSGANVDLVIRAERDAPARHLNTLANALSGIGVKHWKLATAGEVGF